MNNWKCRITVVDENDEVVQEVEVPSSEVLFEHPAGAEDLQTLEEYLQVSNGVVESDYMSQFLTNLNDAQRIADIRRTCLSWNEKFPEKYLQKITVNTLIYVNFNWAAESILYDLPFVRLSDQVEPGKFVLVINPGKEPFSQNVVRPQGSCH